MRPNSSRGYLLATLGAWLGAAVAAGLGALLWRLLTATDDGVTRENLTYGRLLVSLAAALALPVTFCLGPPIGCWRALRLAGHIAAGQTAAVLAACLPLLVLLTIAVARGVISAFDPRKTWQFHPAFLLLPAVVLAPPLARFVTLQIAGTRAEGAVRVKAR